MPSNGLSNGVKICYPSRQRHSQCSVIVKLNKSSTLIQKERQARYALLACMWKICTHPLVNNSLFLQPWALQTGRSLSLTAGMLITQRALLSSTDSWGIPKNEIWLGNHLKSHSHSCGIQMGMNSHEIIPGILGTEWVWEHCHFYHNFGKGMSLGILGMSHK